MLRIVSLSIIVGLGLAVAASLPASFPRATLGGNLAGLIDPAATVETDKITWTSTTIREGLNGVFGYDGLRLNGFRKYGTHFTTNSNDFVP